MCRAVQHEGEDMLEVCSQGSPGAMQTTFWQLADQGKAGSIKRILPTREMAFDRINKAKSSVAAEDKLACKAFDSSFGSEA